MPHENQSYEPIHLSRLSLIVVLCLLGTSRLATTAIGVALGAGGFGYSVFWMWAGFRAPALGSSGAAKESLKWLSMPSSGAFVLATCAVLFVLLITVIQRQQLSAVRNENA